MDNRKDKDDKIFKNNNIKRLFNPLDCKIISLVIKNEKEV